MDYGLFLEKIQTTVSNKVHLFSTGAYEISILPGWLFIIEQLLEDIDHILSNTQNARVKIVTIKEKFGALRIYYGITGANGNIAERIGVLVGEAEQKSESTCMICGAKGLMEEDEYGVFSVKCDEHQGKEIEFENLSLHQYAQHEDAMFKILKLN